jgi:ABC-type multidrug transport system fused ATPase/permease subunit
MNFFYKNLSILLTRGNKKELVYLTFLLIIGMILEMGGVGILIPALSFLLNTNIENHPSYAKYVKVILGDISTARIILYGLIGMFIFYLVKMIFLVYSSHRQSRFVNNLSRDLSKELFTGYMQMPFVFHLQRNSSELQRNIQIEILHFSGICLAALSLATEISTIFGICVLFLYVEPIGAISVIIFFGFFTYIFNKITTARITSWGYQRQEFDGLSNKYLLEGLGGVKQIKLTQREDFFVNKFMGPVIGKGNANKKIQVLSVVPRLYLELLAVGGISIIFLVLTIQQKPLNNLIPIIGIFMAAAFRLIPSINKIINSIQIISFSTPVLKLLADEFGIVRKVISKSVDILEEVNFESQIIFNHVSYSYPESERKVLDDVCFTIQKGDFIGIVGTTGSGKSTLIDLLVGLLAPDSGDILIDGKRLNTIVNPWQQLIGYVPQSIYLTDDTLRNNIAFGVKENLIEEEKVRKAILTSQLSDFVNNLPEGLDTLVGERGVRLSGGERQRIAIARALYHDPPILILDEATSSLDNFTEKEFMNSVNALQGTKTIIIVAHRLTTVEKCDIVYEFLNGKINKVLSQQS